MTALDDLLLDVPPIETEADFLDALHDPDLRWYALRRRRALTAAGILGASSFELLHPRGKDGKWIKKWGVVRWFDFGSYVWRQGIVREIDTDNGQIRVVRGDGETVIFTNPKSLYARPTPKAAMVLPSPGDKKPAPGFEQVGSQGGSNPGGFFQVVDANAAVPGAAAQDPSPDISQAHNIQRPMRLIAESQIVAQIGINPDTVASTLAVGMEGTTVVVPRIDGTPNRYDVVTKIGSQWFRIPAKGSLTDAEGKPRSDLIVTENAVFGDPNSVRRHELVDDPIGMMQFIRRAEITPDNLAATVQEAASNPPVVGDKFYVKTMPFADRVNNEALANDLYEAAGIAVPEVSVGEDGLTLSSKLIGEKVKFDRHNPDHVKAAQDGFVIDAWLANWDAVGLQYDNMQVAPDGTVWRVDAGGALKYRAMVKSGSKGQMFGPEVGELDSLRNSAINPAAASVYGSITEDQMRTQGVMLRSITPNTISTLCERWDMPDMTDTLIARRKSILDQLDIDTHFPIIEPDVTPPPAPSVYNPVEQVMQPGKPPAVAVHNYETALADIPTTKMNYADLQDKWVMENVLFVQHGGLWLHESGWKYENPYTTMIAVNQVTGERAQLTLYPGDEMHSLLSTDDTAQIEDLADSIKVKRDLAIAEIAATSLQFDSLNEAMSNPAWTDQYPEYLRPTESLVYHINDIEEAIGSKQMTADGPLYNSATGKVYEILSVEPLAGQSGSSIKLRESGNGEFTVNNTGFMNTGPWRMPTSHTMQAMYRARLQPASDEPHLMTQDGKPVKVGDSVTYQGILHSVQEIDPVLENLLLYSPPYGTTLATPSQVMSVGGSNLDYETTVMLESIVPGITPGGDSHADTSPYTTPIDHPLSVQAELNTKGEKMLANSTASHDEKLAAMNEYNTAVDAYKEGSPIPATPMLDKLSNTGPLTVDQDAVTVGGDEFLDMVEAEAVAKGGPTYGQQIDEETNLLKALGPGKPLYTANMSTDPENWKDLIGQSVVVLHSPFYESPGSTLKLSKANGLIRITEVDQETPTKMWIRGVKGNGDLVSIAVHPAGAYHKYIIPVTVEPVPMPMTLKTGQTYHEGQIRSGNRVIGEWYKPYAESWTTVHPAMAYGTKQKNWRAVIYADESITGHPVVVNATSKSQLKSAVFGMTRPVAPKTPKKKKKTAVFTEAEIAKLKQHYIEKFSPEITAQVTEEMQKTYVSAPPVGQQPLASGEVPTVGQWVYSPKDHTWWQVTQTDPKLTGKQPGTNIRVKRMVAGTGEWKESFRGRSTMYAVEKYGEIPTTFSPTNAITLGDGKKAGPGMTVLAPGIAPGQGQRVVEVKGGKVKVVAIFTGKTQWVEAGSLQLPASDKEGTVLISVTDAQLQDIIDATVNMTVEEKVLAAIASDLAAATPAKKKKGPNTYPGPDGLLIKQPPGLVDAHLAKGQNLLADGFGPQVGLVVRDKKGNRWVVLEVGEYWKTSQKNSVKVGLVGEPVGYYSGKWRANSTMVVDHEAMLTDKDGKPLPRLGNVTHPSGAEIPNGATIFRQDIEVQGDYDKVKKQYRKHLISRYWAVGGEKGPLYVRDLATGDQVYGAKSIYAEATRVGIVDHAAGDQHLTITVGKGIGKYNPQMVTGFVIHNPGEDPTALLAGQQAPKSAGVTVGEIPEPPAPVELKIGDKVTLAGTEDVMTITWVYPEYVSVVFEDGQTGDYHKSQVGLPPSPKFKTKDGKEIVVGMEAKWNDADVTVLSINQDSGQITVGIHGVEPTEFGGSTTYADALESMPGISPPPPDLPPAPAEPTLILTDGTEIHVHDTITVNGKEAYVHSISPMAYYYGDEKEQKLKVHYNDAPSDVYAYVYTGKDVIGTNAAVAVTTPQPPPPTVPATPPTPPPPPTGVTLSGDLPAFPGDVGGELPHPAPTAHGAPIQAPPVTHAGAPLGSTGALQEQATASVMAKFHGVQAKVKENKAQKTRNWAAGYAIGDGSAVEDMMFHTQVLRDGNGNERTEITFKLSPQATQKTRERLLTKGGATYGDWAGEQVDPKNLVPGDQIALRKSQEKDGVLKPWENAAPNAVITTEGVLIGKATEPQAIMGLDVYRFEVAFTNGETGVIELVSGHSKPFYRHTWDETKIRHSNTHGLGLNPSAAADGWVVASTTMTYPKGPVSDLTSLAADQAKKAPNGQQKTADGSGHILHRDLDGAEISYWTTADLNTLNGRVTISVPSDDPDAQAKLSAAMEAVGVTPEMQAPPDAKQLAKMALDKVYTQFAATYNKGFVSNSTADEPSQALGLIEQAVGQQLREVTGDPTRKVTLADISIRTAPDGRVQVLLSHDVAEAISKRNGANTYTHAYYGGVEAVFMSMTSTPGLMSTNERWSSGLWHTGKSSEVDHTRDSAEYLFMRPYKHATHTSGGTWYMITPADTMHRFVDYYYNEDDGFGRRSTNNTTWLDLPSTGGSSEIMVKKRVETELFGRILAPNESERLNMIERLKAWGRPKAPNGAEWEDFITAGTLDSAAVIEPDFGEERTLEDLLAAA